eukprot:CAMPEP_0116880804 /NCGR_PEP_ID=MMETSP0463-20121206/12803_1 /TAXON_ID=181622 /ORGANISM="Strombidinopsis sp, Strain SopsisLIS2011" /LENGTH=70 /DNA_ID=CAMNT_0004531889 /DNA_START=643 /DNA_END=855 /DNA_ORIENTATION=+
MVHERNEEKKHLEEMNDEDRLQMQAQKAKLKLMFRDDDDTDYYPIIVKASQAGALETLMMEAVKIIDGQY